MLQSRIQWRPSMIFSSLTFLFCFLPLTLLVYFLAPRSLRNSVLLLASLLFYTWGEGLFVALMLGSISLNYVAGLLIQRQVSSGKGMPLAGLFVALNLTLLVTFKYANFLVDNINLLSGVDLDLDLVHLPIGISFFTFQAISYLIDVQRGQAQAQRNVLNLALYISMFPQLIAGPIVRYHDVAQQIRERIVLPQGFASGIQRFVVGLAKKVLLANVLGQVADQSFALDATELSAGLAWMGVVCYALQIYFDFSGYSDMAIGLGRMFGFQFLENFRYPYIARSVQEFWRRWHISLSSWFRDYLYIPLGGNRVSALRVYANLALVFFLCGLWHGAAWNFVIWGLLHGAFLIFERVGLGKQIARWPRPIAHAYTMVMVLVAWVFFRSESLGMALDYLGVMFTGGGADALTGSVFLNREVMLALVLGIPACTPIAVRVGESLKDCGPWALGLLAFLRLVFLAGLFASTVLYLIAGTYNPFIYFRF